MAKTETPRSTFGAAFKQSIPVLTGLMILGITYGILMHERGYGPLWSALFSALAFCGSMQYAALTLLTVVFDPVQAFLLSFLVNARHLFYGLAMLDKYRDTGALRPLLIFGMCDETFSICVSVEPVGDPKRFYFYVTLLNYCYWVIGSFVGGLIGSAFHFNTEGLDFVLTALFVVLFLEQWKVKENRIPALIGFAAAAVSVLVFPGSPMLPAMGLILLALLAGRRQLC